MGIIYNKPMAVNLWCKHKSLVAKDSQEMWFRISNVILRIEGS